MISKKYKEWTVRPRLILFFCHIFPLIPFFSAFAALPFLPHAPLLSFPIQQAIQTSPLISFRRRDSLNLVFRLVAKSLVQLLFSNTGRSRVGADLHFPRKLRAIVEKWRQRSCNNLWTTSSSIE